MSLTDRQEAYVRARLNGKSQREAYREAYPRSVKWKDNSVDNKACLLEKNAKVMQRLSEYYAMVKASAEEKCIVTTDRVLQQLGEIGFADMRDLFDKEGIPLPPNQLPDRIARCVVSVDAFAVGGGMMYKYRLNPKDKSLALMAQILGMLQPKSSDDGEDTSINITPVYGRDDDG